MICIKCGAVLSESAKFCNRCGTKVERKPLKRYCMSCGAGLTEDQLICTNCGTRFHGGQEKKEDPSFFEKKSKQDTSEDPFIKRFENIHYTIRHATSANVKKGKGTIVMYKDRSDLMLEFSLNFMEIFGIILAISIGMWFAILLGEMIAGTIGAVLMPYIAVVVCKKISDAWRTSKSVKTCIFYSAIKSYERGKYGMHPSVIITLKNGTVYTFVVKKKQDEIFGIIEENVTAVL